MRIVDMSGSPEDLTRAVRAEVYEEYLGDPGSYYGSGLVETLEIRDVTIGALVEPGCDYPDELIGDCEIAVEVTLTARLAPERQPDGRLLVIYDVW